MVVSMVNGCFNVVSMVVAMVVSMIVSMDVVTRQKTEDRKVRMVKTQVSSLKPNNHNTTATTMQQLEENRTHKVPQLHTTPHNSYLLTCVCAASM